MRTSGSALRTYWRWASNTRLSDTENLDNFQNHTGNRQWRSRWRVYSSSKRLSYIPKAWAFLLVTYG